MKNIGKLVALLLAAIMPLTIVGCGGTESATQEEQKVIRLGYLEKSDSEQQSLENWRKEAGWPTDYSLEVSQYTSVNEMLLDLNAGKIDSMSVPNCTANYIAAADDQLTNVMSNSDIYEDYCMATRDTDSGLCSSLNDALDEMKADGTMEELVKTYLEDTSGSLAQQTQVNIDGAPVYKVGITGDYAPFDYVSADGTPAGFNMALLNEISKKAGINFQIVQVETPARMTALASGKIDVVFWMGYTESDGYQPSAEGLCLTNAYHSEPIAAVAKKTTDNAQEQAVPTQGYLTMLDFEKEQRSSFCAEPPYPSLSFEEYNRQSYSSLSELQLALNGGKIDWAYLPFDTAKYMQSENQDLTVAVDASVVYSYAMAAREEDSALTKQLTEAISAMREDGTLSTLEDQYIYSLQGQPTEAAIPTKKEGAPTIRIGLTGSLPPFDYVSADGTPGGFNVAFANALGERLGMNIELTTLEVDARLTALVSKKIDVVFWMVVDDSTENGVANGVSITQPYHKSYGAAITKDYPYEDILNRFGLLQIGGK
ncbi:MAG: transporter substrate-binding domain-containing protein [Candidatus Metalachnospira sp.]|nr:transporter substrate-binding domain-containing protein [Candidatus Metalachnospira sp.]